MGKRCALVPVAFTLLGLIAAQGCLPGGALTDGTNTAPSAETGAPDSSSGGNGGPYLLAFQARDISGGIDPSDNTNCTVYLAQSDDGAAWTPVSGFSPYAGSVPDIVRRGNTLYFYTPDPDLVTRYDLATGMQTSSVPVVIRLADGTNDHYGDVSPFLEAATGKIVLFYKATKGYSGDPAYGTLPICSATEIEGSDGTAFVKDDGERLAPSQHADTSVFFDGSTYFLYVGAAIQPGQTPTVRAYTSETLRGAYLPIDTLTDGVLVEGASVPEGHYNAATGEYWTYVTVLNPAGPAIIQRAVHRDFGRKLTDADLVPVISNATFPGLASTDSPESPGFASIE